MPTKENGGQESNWITLKFGFEFYFLLIQLQMTSSPLKVDTWE